MTLGMRSDQSRLDAKPKRAPPAHLPNASASEVSIAPRRGRSPSSLAVGYRGLAAADERQHVRVLAADVLAVLRCVGARLHALTCGPPGNGPVL